MQAGEDGRIRVLPRDLHKHRTHSANQMIDETEEPRMPLKIAKRKAWHTIWNQFVFNSCQHYLP